MKSRLISAAFVVTAITLSACSSDTVDSAKTDVESAITEVGDAIEDGTNNAAEALARSIATQQGEEQFKNSGNELDGPLTCEATIADGVAKIDINCTGTAKGGGAATLTGQTNEIPGASVVTLDGQFTGAVDGTEVFSTERLGG